MNLGMSSAWLLPTLLLWEPALTLEKIITKPFNPSFNETLMYHAFYGATLHAYRYSACALAAVAKGFVTKLCLTECVRMSCQ